MIATTKPSRVRETCRGCLIELRGRIRSIALIFLIRPTWLPDVLPAAITVGNDADLRVVAQRRLFSLRAAAGADLVHRVEHRRPRGRLESARKDRRSRRLSVVPLLEECQAIRDVLELTGATVTTTGSCVAGSGGNWSGIRGAKWLNGHYGDTLYNHFYNPNSRQFDCGNASHNYGLTAARSRHTGGVHVTLCDGSVRFVSENIDLLIWQGIATRQGGEVVREF